MKSVPQSPSPPQVHRQDVEFVCHDLLRRFEYASRLHPRSDSKIWMSKSSVEDPLLITTKLIADALTRLRIFLFNLEPMQWLPWPDRCVLYNSHVCCISILKACASVDQANLQDAYPLPYGEYLGEVWKVNHSPCSPTLINLPLSGWGLAPDSCTWFVQRAKGPDHPHSKCHWWTRLVSDASSHDGGLLHPHPQTEPCPASGPDPRLLCPQAAGQPLLYPLLYPESSKGKQWFVRIGLKSFSNGSWQWHVALSWRTCVVRSLWSGFNSVSFFFFCLYLTRIELNLCLPTINPIGKKESHSFKRIVFKVFNMKKGFYLALLFIDFVWIFYTHDATVLPGKWLVLKKAKNKRVAMPSVNIHVCACFEMTCDYAKWESEKKTHTHTPSI